MRFSPRSVFPFLLACSVAEIFAGGFLLTPQNASGLGVAYSNAAAAADASVIFQNAAGLTRLQRPQVVLAGSVISLSARFENTGSSVGGLLPLSGSTGGDAGGSSFLPTLFYAQPLSETVTAGLGVFAPFGLETDYEAGWIGRYHALHSELRTLNVNPVLAWRAREALSLAVGVGAQRAEAKLSNRIDFGLAGLVLGLPGFAPGSHDSLLEIEGDDWGYGWNAGLLWSPAESTRLGLHYRSKISHNLEGPARFSGVPAPFAAGFPSQSMRAPLSTPELLSLHLYQEIGDNLALTADVLWTRWSRFDALQVDFAEAVTPDVRRPADWKNALLASAGLTWRCHRAIALKAGAAHNESPVPDDARRDPRIPDSDRVWLTAGLAWNFGDSGRLDLGYAHLFFRDASLANDDGQGHLLRGNLDVSVNIVGVQGSWNF